MKPLFDLFTQEGREAFDAWLAKRFPNPTRCEDHLDATWAGWSTGLIEGHTGPAEEVETADVRLLVPHTLAELVRAHRLRLGISITSKQTTLTVGKA